MRLDQISQLIKDEGYQGQSWLITPREVIQYHTNKKETTRYLVPNILWDFKKSPSFLDYYEDRELIQ